MKICFVCNEYPPAPHGGIGTFIYNLAHELVKNNFEVFVIGFDSRVNKKSQWYEEVGIKVFRIYSPFRNFPIMRIKNYEISLLFLLERTYLSNIIKKYNKQYRFDIIESYDWSGPLMFKPSEPLIIRFHGANTAYQYYEGLKISHLLKYIEKRNVLMGDALVSVSKHIGDVTLQSLAIHNRNYSVIYNGINTNHFMPNYNKIKSYEVLYVGSITRRKGIYSLLKIIPLVLEKVPEASFHLIGKFPSEDEGKRIKNQLQSSLSDSMRQRVNFLGVIPYGEIAEWFSRAAVSVFPAYAEACPMVWLESMACGSPIVLTNRASGPEIIEDGKSGLIADPDKPDEFAGKIVQILQDHSLSKYLSNNVRQRVIEEFDIKVISKQNIEYYKEVL